MKFSTFMLFTSIATLPLAASTFTVTSTGDTGATGDLRWAINYANNGDSIDIAPGLSIALTSALTVGIDVTINGSGATINGSSSGEIFALTGSAALTFSNLTLLDAPTAIGSLSGGSVSILDSTISGSSNAIYGVNGTVTNSTLSGNTFGIEYGTVGLYDSTITGGTYGIVYASLTIGNSIVAGNTGSDVSNLSSLTDLGHNLIGSGSGLFVNGVNGDIVGASPDLGSLANNGGPTETMALLPGSPAFNAGDNSIIPVGITTDQRGPGFARIVNGTVDIGAFEEVPEPATYLTCLLGFAIGARQLRKRQRPGTNLS